jgi:hypothetical protein
MDKGGLRRRGFQTREQLTVKRGRRQLSTARGSG